VGRGKTRKGAGGLGGQTREFEEIGVLGKKRMEWCFDQQHGRHGRGRGVNHPRVKSE